MAGEQPLIRVVVLSFILLWATPAGALEWDEFTSNFATDLAPLITLFGEQVTKQFLSESLSIWDNVIFAMAPLGLLTAVVSAIRVCGSASMRAFIGRAQEGPGVVEAELLSCTSQTTAELWNDGGIARVFGAPKILEIVVVEPQDGKCMRIHRFAETNKDKEDDKGRLPWSLSSKPNSLSGYHDEKNIAHNPNLSLNIGIVRPPKWVLYGAAGIGVALQTGSFDDILWYKDNLIEIGVLAFASLTVYVFPNSFPTGQDESGPADRYAFPLTLGGTLLVSLGMFLCAFIIERSTHEAHYRKDTSVKSKIYWIQAGGQKIGDQEFAPFIGFSEDNKYIRSTKSPGNNSNILRIAIAASVVGFITQFVGFRAMHPSVILAQLCATLIMAGVRALLRFRRMDEQRNVLATNFRTGMAGTEDLLQRNMTILNGHELDFFALYLFNCDTITLTGDPNGKIMPLDEDEVRALEGIYTDCT
ncbi:hypothetical protein ABW19_dt0202897 [Dactylella cylindrospora]|nr:hypothetical protein ABW19_dt0202897 [Dactylella cylindrospora]